MVKILKYKDWNKLNEGYYGDTNDIEGLSKKFDPNNVTYYSRYDDYGDKIESWYDDNNMLHNTFDKPARTLYDSDNRVKKEEWYTHGVRDRKGKPAEISYYPNGKINTEKWYDDGVLHREDGPAIFRTAFDNDQTFQNFYIKGKELSKEQFEEYKAKQKLDQAFDELGIGELV